jgi:hypothetical protein
MKYLVTIIVVAFLAISSQSQGLYTLNYTVGFGAGKTADFIGSPSFRGVTFDGRGFISDQVSIGGYFNWQTFYEDLSGASYVDGTATLTGNQYRYINAFPMLVQAHYYFGTDEYAPRAYLGAGLGTYKMIQRVDAGVWSVEKNNWHFGMSPEVGLLYPFGMGSQLNINLKYHYVFGVDSSIDYSWFGLSVGFAWGD